MSSSEQPRVLTEERIIAQAERWIGYAADANAAPDDDRDGSSTLAGLQELRASHEFLRSRLAEAEALLDIWLKHGGPKEPRNEPAISLRSNTRKFLSSREAHP